jgi:hypothetical protein
MTSEQISQQVNTVLNEYLDGYILFAFVAGDSTPMVVTDLPDARTGYALRAVIEEHLEQSTAKMTDAARDEHDV